MTKEVKTEISNKLNEKFVKRCEELGLTPWKLLKNSLECAVIHFEDLPEELQEIVKQKPEKDAILMKSLGGKCPVCKRKNEG